MFQFGGRKSQQRMVVSDPERLHGGSSWLYMDFSEVRISDDIT